MFFTPGKCAIFKNIVTWNDEDFMEGWYTLLGPAEWWVEEYNYESYGFAVPTLDMKQYEAFSMMVTSSVKLPIL